MASKTDILKARLVVARAKEQKNTSKKAKKSKPDTDEKENEKVGMTRGGRKKDAQKDEKEVKAKRNSPAVE
jgi:hypothetical protein